MPRNQRSSKRIAAGRDASDIHVFFNVVWHWGWL
jgi:hypothetical protein